MDANELMIGDWVFAYGRARQVEIIYDNGRIQADCMELSESEFTSILLIPEILEKNGLRKLVTYGTEKWVCDNFRLNVYDSEKTWRFCAYTNRNEDTVVYIHFVHELQHALRLCGIEKEIII